MDALVSGQAGIAIFIYGNDTSYVTVDELSEESVCAPSSVPYLLDGATDVLEFKSIQKHAALGHLKQEWSYDRSLHLALILLDPKEDIETRREAVDRLFDLLQQRETAERLENVLYSNLIPNVSALVEALDLTPAANPVSEMLYQVRANQDIIGLVRKTWEELPLDLFGGTPAKESFRRSATRSGIFRLLVKGVNEPSKFGLVSIECLRHLKSLPNYRAVLNTWMTPFKPGRTSHVIVPPLVENHSSEQEESNKPRHAEREVHGHESFENVKKQKQAITPLLTKGDIHNARKFIEDLIHTQLKSGGARYATMSLCDLAQHAKNVFNHSMQLELAKRAAELCPEDGWAHGQVADAYYCLGQYDNAVAALDRASLWGESAFASAGRARILWGQGRLLEALAAYDQARRDFPNEATIWNGRAEVLRQMWRYEESLEAYTEAAARSSSNRVALCGRAAVLKDLGRFNESLDAYQTAMDYFPQEVVARDGHADVLKEMGRLQDALEAYDRNVALSPEDSVARCGRAEVLRDMGRLEEALQSYKDTIDSFPFVSVPYCGKAETLKDMGKLSSALHCYEDARSRFPLEPRVHNGLANVLKRLGRLDEALKAFDQVTQRFPYDIFALSGRADALKELGKLHDAVEAYSLLIERNPAATNLRYAKAAILVALHRFRDAELLLPTKPPETRDEWIAYHVRGMILLKTNMLRPAIKHFKYGLDSIPFADERKYFQNALAAATLRQRHFHEALDCLGASRSATADALRIHAYGELGNPREALRAYARLSLACPVMLVPLRNELASKYKLKTEPPHHDDAWVFEEECQNILLEAA